MDGSRLFLLDTHVWIWLMEGRREVSTSPVVLSIEQAAEDSRLRVAAISVWEVGMLESKHRIRFAVPCLQWVLNALEAPGVELVPLTPAIAVHSSRLPGDFHGDPADRIIVSTARSLQAVLLTRDRSILEYSRQGHVLTAEV